MWLLMTILAVGAICLSAQQQPAANPKWVPASPKSKPTPKPTPISAYNFRWTTYQNGWAELSFSLRNNLKTDVKNVKFRVIFFGRDGEPIHYAAAEVLGTIPTVDQMLRHIREDHCEQCRKMVVYLDKEAALEVYLRNSRN
jgi:hypothetical protein